MASSGIRARSSFAARAPSSVPSGGIRTSMIARSGCSRSTASTSAGASAARATTSWPASSSSRASPSRKRAESSPITMRTAALPPPRCPGHVGWPPAASRRARRPGRRARTAGRAARRPAPSSVTRTSSWPVAADDLEHDPGRLGVLDRVGDRLARDVVRRGGDGVGQRAVVDLHVDGQRQAADQVRQRRGQAVVEAARPEAVRDLAQLGDRGAELGDALVEQAVDVDRAVVEVPLREPQLHAERDQPLLGSVVEVALDPAALLVADLDEPGPARLRLAQRRARPPSAAGPPRPACCSGRRPRAAARRDAGPEPRTTTPVCSSSSTHRRRRRRGTGSPSASR